MYQTGFYGKIKKWKAILLLIIIMFIHICLQDGKIPVIVVSLSTKE